MILHKCNYLAIKSSSFRYRSLALSRIFQAACLTENIINVITLYIIVVFPAPDLQKSPAYSETPAQTGSSATSIKPPGTPLLCKARPAHPFVQATGKANAMLRS